MLQRTSIFLISITLLLACASSEKLLQRGQYDKAIEKSVKKLRKDPGKEKELYVLKEAYTKANSFDMDRISFLEKEERSENYMEIYTLYQKMDNRQNRIKTLPTSLMREFQIIDYDEKLIGSKEQAAEVSYQQGVDYLELGGRENARQAYYEFERVLSLYENYKDTEQLIEQAQYLGTNQVLFVIENNSESVLPERFDSELRKIGLSELNDRWIQYSVYEDESVEYDYFIVLDIKDIILSPERVDRETFRNSKEVQDGTKYVLDENGNVKKDSLGNDMREPNIITVTAEITESRQWKEATIGGSIDYVNLGTDQLVKTEDLSVTFVFEHFSATFSGDERALEEKFKDMIGVEPIPFPESEFMLMDAANLLKEKAKEIIFSKKDLLRSTGN